MTSTYFAIGIAVALLAFAVYRIGFYKKKQIKKFPKKWRKILESDVEFYQDLTSEKKKHFENRMLDFINDTHIEAIKTTVEAKDKVYLAASAVIPVFAFPAFHYNNLRSVLIYPATFNANLEFDDKAKDKRIGGMVGTGRYEDQLIISRKSLRAAFAPTTQGKNTAIHEFVHLIDKMDGDTDGVPEILMKHSYSFPWLDLIEHEMRKVEKNKSELRDYAATNEAEFFAVAAEYFFEKPDKLEKEHPKLYEQLDYFFSKKKPQEK